MFPSIKIIVSEVTPRMDEFDEQVKVANSSLNKFVDRHENTFIVKHDNLRNPDFFQDAKHIRQDGIARFAANIKKGLRNAYGMQFDRYSQGNERSYLQQEAQRTRYDQQSLPHNHNHNQRENTYWNDRAPFPLQTQRSSLNEVPGEKVRLDVFKQDLIRSISSSIAASISEAFQKVGT